jgi:hypothetical protein
LAYPICLPFAREFLAGRVRKSGLGTQKFCLRTWPKDCLKERDEKRMVVYVDARKGQVCSEKECTQCRHTHSVEYFHRNRRTITGLSPRCLICTFIPTMIEHAKQRNKLRVKKGRKMPKVTVTAEFIIPTTCALSGVELVFCSGHVNLASLDRINDSGGYTNGDVCLVDIRFNTRAKWTSDKYQAALGSGWKHFVETCGKSMPSPETQISGLTLKQKMRCLSTAGNEFRSIKLIRDLWEHHRGCCYYSNIPMSWGHIDEDAWTVSVERLNQGSYTPDNTVLICAEFNSTEYRTDRFEHLFDGKPQGWNRDVVNWYRTRE